MWCENAIKEAVYETPLTFAAKLINIVCQCSLHSAVNQLKEILALLALTILTVCVY